MRRMCGLSVIAVAALVGCGTTPVPREATAPTTVSVQHADGSPVQYVRLYFDPLTHAQVATIATLDESGKVTANLSAGDYRLRFEELAAAGKGIKEKDQKKVTSLLKKEQTRNQEAYNKLPEKIRTGAALGPQFTVPQGGGEVTVKVAEGT